MQYAKTKNRPALKKKKKLFYSSFMQSIFTNSWISVCFIKNKNWAKKHHVFLLLLSCFDSEWWSKHRWNYSLPSTHPKLAQFYNNIRISISFGNVRQFWLIFCLMLDDALCYICICLHARLLVSVFWSRCSILFQKMCNSASYHTSVKTQKDRKLSLDGKELNMKNCVSHFQLTSQLHIQL